MDSIGMLFLLLPVATFFLSRGGRLGLGGGRERWGQKVENSLTERSSSFVLGGAWKALPTLKAAFGG